MKPVLALALALLLPCAAFAKTRPAPNRGAAPSLAILERSGDLLGASSHAMVEGRGDSARTARVLDAAWDRAALVGDVVSPWQAGSEIARLNAAAAAERFACSADLDAAIDSALRAADETGGAYDPTIEPLVRAWDVYGAGRVPAADEIAAARSRVGWRAVARDPATRTVRFTRPGMGFDLGGIARGFALDRAMAMLREGGIARALLDCGGDVLVYSNREPLKVTVPVPGDPATPAIRLALTQAMVATATPDEHGAPAEGMRPGRIIDPASGRPVRGTAAVSVVTRSAPRAQALARALLVMGRERAAGFAAGHAGVGVLWLEPSGSGLQAWAWNLPSLEVMPGVNVVWMTPR